MQEEFYLLIIFYPVIIIMISIIGGILIKKTWMTPAIILLLAVLWTVLEMTLRNIGFASLLGWSIAYVILSLVITLIVKSIKNIISNPDTHS